ncbi:MAG: RNA polymerase factor sigma-54 [Bdellovibrionales bacterium]
MALRQSLNLSQNLVITPQLQQAIKLLQMSRLELESAVRSELEENPILEETVDLKEEDLKRTKEAATEVEGPAESQDPNTQDPRRQDEFEWESYFEQNQKPPKDFSSGNEEIMNYENVMTTTQSLNDYLSWQIKMNGFSEHEERAAEGLLAYMDEDGYIKTPLEQIAQDENLPLEDLEDALSLIQEFDPPGVGARDLKECLLIQARHLEEDTTDLVTILQNHIKDLEKRNYEAISKAIGKEVREVVEICKIIYAMEPKPGRAYHENDTHYVTPDVYVYKVGDDFVVSLNEDGLPRLKISNFYKNMLKGGGANKQEQEYIQEKLKSAVWLIKSIHQRQRTIYRVSEAIVKRQKEFFEKGAGFLKPMVLRDIAGDIGMHESTVSRVTTAKYMHTPQGIYELKYFFNSGINATDGGDALASESVKLKIKDLISKEDPKNPFSDQKIAELLKKDGVDIARRTVAKYREMLRLLPSSQRKKVY